MPRPDYAKIEKLYRWYDAREDCYVFNWEEKERNTTKNIGNQAFTVGHRKQWMKLINN